MVSIQMTPGREAEYFPAGDPRAGYYEPGEVYEVPEEVALALIEGGGYVEAGIEPPPFRKYPQEAAEKPAPIDEEASY